MRVSKFNIVGGWGIKLAKSYDSSTDTLTVEVHNLAERGEKGDKGDPGAAGAAGANGHDGYLPVFTADPTPPYAGYGYLNPTLGTINVWDGTQWWRWMMTPEGPPSVAFSPVYNELFDDTDLSAEYGDYAQWTLGWPGDSGGGVSNTSVGVPTYVNGA